MHALGGQTHEASLADQKVGILHNNDCYELGGLAVLYCTQVVAHGMVFVLKQVLDLAFFIKHSVPSGLVSIEGTHVQARGLIGDSLQKQTVAGIVRLVFREVFLLPALTNIIIVFKHGH